jgi:cation/acetate symporter
MSQFVINMLFVGASFALYFGIAIWARAGSTKEFYVAGGGVHPVTNGMATAADWMSAASFISMAGLIAAGGYANSTFLMGWTGGYVLLAMLLAPYLRKFGKFTVPDFIGDRFYSNGARLAAVVCLIIICVTYVIGQMAGAGVAFSRFLEVSNSTGIWIAAGVVFCYAVFGGMKGITYTQVAQYCVMIFAYMVPAIFISMMVTGNPIPQLGFGSEVSGTGQSVLERLNGLGAELGFTPYTDGSKSTTDIFFITMALMVGTAGLPHVIVRFFTTPTVRDARKSAGYALLFIAVLYTTAPAVAAFARTNLLTSVPNTSYEEVPAWFKTWENAGLIAWMDKNSDGVIQYGPGAAFAGKPEFTAERGASGERLLKNAPTPTTTEVYVDNDIMVLANPEIAGLPGWVIALIAAGGLAAALSTAAGLLLVISTSISHDLLKSNLMPNISEKKELLAARVAAGVAVVVAGLFGIYPPAFVAQVVAFAFGLAAASFFPVIVMGIFSKKMNKEGAIAGMLVGLIFTFSYIVYYKFINPTAGPNEWWFGISPEGIGTLGMIFNFIAAVVVSKFTAAPPEHIQHLVEDIRVPRGAGAAIDH